MNSKQICGIIGFPLNKPRSIPIWREYIKKYKINSSMQEFEIHPKKINKFLIELKKNHHFKAAAVTMPYKKQLLKYVKPADTFSKYSKSNKIRSANKKDIQDVTNLCIQKLEEKNFFKSFEKKPIMLENLRSIFYKMELSKKETRILSSVIASLAKKG